MALRINFNYSAAVTQTALETNNRLMNKSLLRLSTGLRILNAADDSAGLFIADQLALVSAGLEQGNRNIQTGISALQIAENSAGQIYNKLKEIYVKAENAANDINDPNARASLQREIVNLVDAIRKIATDTEYNGIKLLDGSFVNKYIHYGPRSDQSISISIDSVKPNTLGAYMATGNVTTLSNADTFANTISAAANAGYRFDTGDQLLINGVNVLTPGHANGQMLDTAQIAANINNDSTLRAAGIQATATNSMTATNAWSNIVLGSDDTLDVTIYYGATDGTTNSVTISFTNTTITLDDFVSAVNAYSGTTGVTAVNSDGVLKWETTDGRSFAIELTATHTTDSFSVDLTRIADVSSGSLTSTTAGASHTFVRLGTLEVSSPNAFTVSVSPNNAVSGLGGNFTGTGTAPSLYNIESINVLTNAGAEQALKIISAAIQKVDTVRGKIGAVMNNLQSIYDAQKVAKDNTNQAENVIRNVDFAEEMSRFTTMQIRMQSGIAMLAQANTLPQLVLQLLR